MNLERTRENWIFSDFEWNSLSDKVLSILDIPLFLPFKLVDFREMKGQ